MEHHKEFQVLVCQMLLPSVAVILSACGGNGTPTPPPKTLRSIQVTPQNQSFAVVSSLRLGAAGRALSNHNDPVSRQCRSSDVCFGPPTSGSTEIER